MCYNVYLSDVCLRRAVERNITIIGEAMNRLLKVAPEIEISSARNIVDTSNYVIHGYDSVTDDIMWGSWCAICRSSRSKLRNSCFEFRNTRIYL